MCVTLLATIYYIFLLISRIDNLNHGNVHVLQTAAILGPKSVARRVE